MDNKATKDKTNRDLTWGQLLTASIVIYFIGIIFGGSNTATGSIVSVGAYVVFLITFVNAWKQGGFKAFAIAFVITFFVLGFGAQINLSTQ